MSIQSTSEDDAVKGTGAWFLVKAGLAMSLVFGLLYIVTSEKPNLGRTFEMLMVQWKLAVFIGGPLTGASLWVAAFVRKRWGHLFIEVPKFSFEGNEASFAVSLAGAFLFAAAIGLWVGTWTAGVAAFWPGVCFAQALAEGHFYWRHQFAYWKQSRS